MKVAIMTDSNSSITVEEGRESGIYVLPLPVIVDEEVFIEGETITSQKLYESMNQGKSVRTSQPSPGELMDMWQSILDEGYDEIVYIPMTKRLSGSYESALNFAREFDGKVQVVNNLRLSVMQYESVYDAKSMADNGMDAKSIKERLEKASRKSFMVLTVDTLSYLKNGGRVSASKALVATLANIKPILMLIGEELEVQKKARGLQVARNKLIDLVKEKGKELYGSIPKEKLVVGVIDTFVEDSKARELVEKVKEVFPGYKILNRKCPCSVACHVGPNAIGVSITVTDRI